MPRSEEVREGRPAKLKAREAAEAAAKAKADKIKADKAAADKIIADKAAAVAKADAAAKAKADAAAKAKADAAAAKARADAAAKAKADAAAKAAKARADAAAKAKADAAAKAKADRQKVIDDRETSTRLKAREDAAAASAAAARARADAAAKVKADADAKRIADAAAKARADAVVAAKARAAAAAAAKAKADAAAAKARADAVVAAKAAAKVKSDADVAAAKAKADRQALIDEREGMDRAERARVAADKAKANKAAADKIKADKAAADKIAADKAAKIKADKAAADKIVADEKAAADKIVADEKAAADKIVADDKTEAEMYLAGIATDAEGAPSGSSMSKEDKARAEALYKRGVDIGFDAIAYSNRMREILKQPPLDRDTILANSLAEQDAKQQWAEDNPEFDLAIWYQQQQTDPTLQAKLARETTNAENNYDPGRGEMRNLGNNFENYAYMNVYEKPFIDKIRESNASISATLSSPLEIDYPYNYDATTLYMKLPRRKGNYVITQGFSQEERAKYNYLKNNGKFIDTSEGRGGVGEYTMMWIANPPEKSRWAEFITNPVVNIVAALIPGGAQVVALAKAATGMTMHASDWFAAAGGYDVVATKFADIAEGLGEIAGSALGGANTALGRFTAAAVAKGTTNAISAVITDQDPLDAFLMGGIDVGVGRVLGEVNRLTDGALDKLEETGGFTKDTREYDAKGDVVKGSAPVAVGKITRDLIQEAIASQLSTGEISPQRMANIISTAVITTEAVKGFTGEALSAKGIGILTSSIQSSLNAAITGGDVSDAFLRTLATQTERAVRKSLNEGTFAEDASSTWDRASGTYDTIFEQKELADAAAEKNSTAANEINGINKAITDEATELDRLLKVKSDLLAAAGGSISKMTDDQINAYDVADKAAARYEADFKDRVNDDYTPRLVSANEAYETSTTDYNEAKTAYEEAYNTLSETTQEFDDAINAQLPEIAKAAIADINPNFDPKFYAKQNGIDESEAYQHYMSNGLYNNLPGSSEEYVAQYKTKQWGAVNTSLSNLSVDPTKITPEQYTNINSILSRNIDINSNEPIDQATVDRLVLVALAADVIPQGGLATAATNAILKSYGRPEQEVGTPLTDNTIKILTNNAINTQDNQDIGNSWTPNSQLVPDQDTGLLKWEDVSLSFDDDGLRWDDTRGEFVHWRSDGRITDTRGNVLGMHITVTEGNNTLEWLKANNPEGYLAAVAEMEEENAPEAGVDPWLLTQIKKEFAADAKTGGANQKLFSNFYVGTASVLQDIQSVIAIAGIDPKSTPLFAALEQISKFAGDQLPEETRANTAAMMEIMQSGEGFKGTLSAIGNAISEYPSEFVTQIIALEGVQELVPLLVTAVVTGGVGTAARFAKVGADAAKIMATRAGLSAGMTVDLAESYGGAFNGAYSDAYATALKSGMTKQEADTYAVEVAHTTALAAGTFTLISMGVGGAALERAYGASKGTLDKAFDEISYRIANGAVISVKEGVSEGLEEGATQLVLESILHLIDPTRDASGAVTLNAILGALVGGPIGGVSVMFEGTGNPTADVLRLVNPKVQYYLAQEDLGPTELEDALELIGVSGVVQTDLLNQKYDDIYTSSAEATNAFDSAGLPATQADIEAMVGRTDADFDLDAELTTYWADTRGTTADTDGDGINNEDDYAPNDPTESGNSTAQQEWEQALEQAAIDQAAADQAAADQIEADRIEADTVVDEEVDTIVDEGVDAIVDEEVDTIVDEEVDAIVDEEVDTVVDEEVDAIVDEEVDTIVDEEVDTVVDEEVDTIVDEGVDAIVDEEVDTIVDEEVDAIVDEEVDTVVDEEVDAIVDEEVDTGTEEDTGTDEEGDTGTEDSDFEVALAESEAAILAKIQENEDAGMDRDTALATAIADVSTELGLAKEDLLTAIGTTEADLTAKFEAGLADLSTEISDLSTQLTDVEASILTKIQENEDAGMDRDTALSTAIADVSTELGFAKEDLLTAIGTTEADLTAKFEAGLAGVATEISNVATLVGKPASEVTQADIDAYTDILANIEAGSDTNTTVFTEEQLQYDVNKDGVVDAADQAMVEQSFGGQDVSLGGKFAATGLYATQEEYNRQLQEQADTQFEQQQEQQREMQQQLSQQMAKQAGEDRFREFTDLLGSAKDLSGRQVKTSPGELANIKYLYDFDSVFANPKQEGLFAGPYGRDEREDTPMAAASGGLIETENDRFLRLIRGN